MQKIDFGLWKNQLNNIQDEYKDIEEKVEVKNIETLEVLNIFII